MSQEYMAFLSGQSATMEDYFIRVFRIFVSGDPSTFDSIDAAIGYIRGQTIQNNITGLVMETAYIKLSSYMIEVERQESEVK